MAGLPGLSRWSEDSELGWQVVFFHRDVGVGPGQPLVHGADEQDEVS
jgi:hypothetical protein